LGCFALLPWHAVGVQITECLLADSGAGCRGLLLERLLNGSDWEAGSGRPVGEVDIREGGDQGEGER